MRAKQRKVWLNSIKIVLSLILIACLNDLKGLSKTVPEKTGSPAFSEISLKSAPNSDKKFAKAKQSEPDYEISINANRPPSPYSVFWSKEHYCKNNLLRPKDFVKKYDYHGCNAVRFYPIPGKLGDYFQRFGIHFKDKNDPCSFQEVGIRVAQLNESANPPFFKPGDFVFDPPPPLVGIDFTGGKFKVDSGYDQSAVTYNNEIWTAFECYGNSRALGGMLGFGMGFDKAKSDTVSACIAPYNPILQQIDASRGTIPILGGSTVPGDSHTFSASVPKLLVHKGRIYLYWSATKVDRHSGKWYKVSIRGIELEQELSGQKRLWAKGLIGKEIMANDPVTSEVWEPGQQSDDNTLADAYQLVSDDEYVYILGNTGGSGCVSPIDQIEGCYQFSISRSHTPLGKDVFTRNKLNHFPVRNTASYTFFDNAVTGLNSIIGVFTSVKDKPGNNPSLNGIYRVKLPHNFSKPTLKSWDGDFLTELTLDIFGRKPSLLEVQKYIFPESQVALTPQQLVEAVLNRDKVELILFKHAYEMVFAHPLRDLRDEERDKWISQLRTNGYAKLIKTLLKSDDGKNPAAQAQRRLLVADSTQLGEELITFSYRQFLHRAPDSGDMQSALALLSSDISNEAVWTFWVKLLASQEKQNQIYKMRECR
jgi:hypothetical protein